MQKKQRNRGWRAFSAKPIKGKTAKHAKPLADIDPDMRPYRGARPSGPCTWQRS